MIKRPSDVSQNIENSESHMVKTGNIAVAGGNPPTIPMAPPMELNPKNLFGQNLNSNDARIDRLERVVQDMRNDFSDIKPSVQRLVSIEGDMSRLVEELTRINDTAEAVGNMTPKAAPAPKKAAPKKVSAPAVKSVPSGVTGVYDVRIGEHPGKTRIVFDVGSKTDFRTDIDNSEKIMIVDLPNANWDTSMEKSFKNSPYIASYKVEPSGDGHLVIFQLKKNAKISYKEDLKSLSGSGRRIVIDVSGA